MLLALLLVAAEPAPPLSLPRAMELAIAGDPSIAAGTERVIAAQASESSAWAPFIPALTFQLDAAHRVDPLAGPFFSFFTPDSSVNSQVLHGGVGVRGALPTGTAYELGLDQTVGFYSSLSEALNPKFEPGVHLRLVQPFLKGLWPSANLAPVDLAHAHVSEAEADALARRDRALLDVSDAWLDAVRAKALLTLREESIELATAFEKLTRQRIEGGEQSALDLALALQTVAARQFERSRAAADQQAALENLAERLHAPKLDLSTVILDAKAVSAWPAPTVNAADATRQAAARSPALRRLQAQLAGAQAEIARASDAGAPDLRLALEGQVRGLSGTSTCQGGYLADSITPCGVDPTYQGGYDRALGNLAEGKFYSVGVIVSGSFPTWFGPAAASGEAARHASAAVAADERAEEERVASDTARLVRTVADRALVATASSKAVTLAEDALKAEETKLKGGRSTGFDLTRAQDLLIAARVDELESKLALARAQLRLRAAVGELGPEHAALFP